MEYLKVLGPILFVTYINTYSNIDILNGSLISNADDGIVMFDWFSSAFNKIKLEANGIKKVLFTEYASLIVERPPGKEPTHSEINR